MNKRASLVLASVGMLLTVTACTASPEATGDAGGETGSGGGGEKALRIGQEYDLGTLDPAVMTSVGDQQMTSNLYDGLLRYKLGTVELGPGLATEWESDEAGTTWTFQLREGVQFHDGYGELTASDVVFSLSRILEEETASPHALLLGAVEEVRADGDFTVVIELSEPDPSLLDKLASWYTGILSQKAVEERGEDYPQNPVGTGPYQFEKWTPGQETVLTAHDDYWGGEPNLDQVTYKSMPDVTTRNNAFLAKEIDINQVTDPEIFAQYEGTEGVELVSEPGLITRFFGMKTDEPPFDDPLVREAVTLAINRDAMLEGIFKGISTPAEGILSPAVLHAKTDILGYEYDPERAKELLDEAGYGDGVDVTFTVPNVDRFTRPATVIQQDLGAVGINVEIEVMETQSLLTALKSEEGLQMFILSRGQDPTPDRVLSAWFHSQQIPDNNWARIQDPEVDAWLDEATSTVDEDRRAELFGQVQERVAEGNFYYYIDHEDFIFGAHERVKGFVADPKRSLRLDEVTVED